MHPWVDDTGKAKHTLPHAELSAGGEAEVRAFMAGTTCLDNISWMLHPRNPLMAVLHGRNQCQPDQQLQGLAVLFNTTYTARQNHAEVPQHVCFTSPSLQDTSAPACI